MCKKFLFCLFFFNTFFVTHSQWVLKYPKLPPLVYTKVQTLNSTDAYIAGAKGSILKSTDKGITWQTEYIGKPADIRDMHFINPDTGFVVEGQNIWRTVNKGKTWQQIYTADKILYQIKFHGNNGFAIPFLVENFKYYRSTDRGLTWSAVPFVSTIDDICFKPNINGSGFTGFMNTYKGLFKSTDDGITWNLSDSIWTNKISFADSRNGLRILGGSIWKTTDGGDSWLKVPVTNIDLYIKSINYLDSLTAFITKTAGAIYKSSNGGLTWSKKNVGVYDIVNTAFFNLNEGIAVGQNLLLVTNNGGESWSNLVIQRPFDITLLQSAGKNTVYAAGFINLNSTLLKSIDKGETWINNELPFHIKDFYALDSVTIYAACDSSKLRLTTDGGANWVVKRFDSTASLSNVYFLNRMHGFVTTDSKILRTTDGGVNWNYIPDITDNKGLSKISFIDSNNGMISQKRNMLYKTTDGGVTWSGITLPYSGITILDFAFINNNVIYCCIYQDSPSFLGQFIAKTTNGGINWTKLEGTDYSNAVYFKDVNNGIFVSNRGNVYKTANGGVSWSSSSLGTTGDLLSVTFSDSVTGYIAGNGVIYKTTNGGLTFVENELKETPENFYLEQNYPNPFNPVTTISYRTTTSGFVTLKVYDILGRETALLVNEYKPAGAHKVTFTVKDLPSGVYFYSLRVNEYTSVKKMVLIK